MKQGENSLRDGQKVAAAESHDGGFTHSSILGLFSDLEFYVAAGKVNVFFFKLQPLAEFQPIKLDHGIFAVQQLAYYMKPLGSKTAT